MHTTANTPMTSPEIEQRKARVADLSVHLADFIEGATRLMAIDHTLVLEALLHTFIVTAEVHTCCTRPAALACVAAATRLQKTAIHRLDSAMLH